MNRNLFLRRVLHDRRDVRRRARPNDARRTLLERTAVRRKELKNDFVATNVSSNQAAEVFLKSRLRRGERFGHRNAPFDVKTGGISKKGDAPTVETSTARNASLILPDAARFDKSRNG